MKTKSHLFQAGLVLGLIHRAWAQPIITNQPQNQTNVAGPAVTFTVAATGAQPLSHQWRAITNHNRYTNLSSTFRPNG